MDAEPGPWTLSPALRRHRPLSWVEVNLKVSPTKVGLISDVSVTFETDLEDVVIPLRYNVLNGDLIPVPPRVDLNRSHRGDKKTRRNPKKGDRRKGQSGHACSAANPYGKRGAGDARQFSY